MDLVRQVDERQQEHSLALARWLREEEGRWKGAGRVVEEEDVASLDGACALIVDTGNS